MASENSFPLIHKWHAGVETGNLEKIKSPFYFDIGHAGVNSTNAGALKCGLLAKLHDHAQVYLLKSAI